MSSGFATAAFSSSPKPMMLSSSVEYIIKQGEQGNTFYFLEEGEAEALKKNSDGKEEVVYSYRENDYFGELALINDMPRQASVRAKTVVKVVSIDRLAFNRLLGNLIEILKRN